MRRLLATFLAGCVLLPKAAPAADLWVNPGTMGANALPVVPGEAPWIEDALVLRLGGAGQLSAAGDRSAVPSFRLEAPLGRWGMLISEGIPLEAWRATPETAERWGLERTEGVSKGDLSFGVKALLVDGGDRFPSLALRNLTKTTTGKSYRERRFTNAPAYLLDALLAQRFLLPGGVRAEAWVAAGFFAWQQGANGQNDAFAWSGTLAARWPGGGLLRADVRGYTGWQTGDRPRVVGLGAEWPFGKHLAGSLIANFGLQDAPMVDLRAALVLRLPALLPLDLARQTH